MTRHNALQRMPSIESILSVHMCPTFALCYLKERSAANIWLASKHHSDFLFFSRHSGAMVSPAWCVRIVCWAFTVAAFLQFTTLTSISQYMPPKREKRRIRISWHSQKNRFSFLPIMTSAALSWVAIMFEDFCPSAGCKPCASDPRKQMFGFLTFWFSCKCYTRITAPYISKCYATSCVSNCITKPPCFAEASSIAMAKLQAHCKMHHNHEHNHHNHDKNLNFHENTANTW